MVVNRPRPIEPTDIVGPAGVGVMGTDLALMFAAPILLALSQVERVRLQPDAIAATGPQAAPSRAVEWNGSLYVLGTLGWWGALSLLVVGAWLIAVAIPAVAGGRTPGSILVERWRTRSERAGRPDRYRTPIQAPRRHRPMSTQLPAPRTATPPMSAAAPRERADGGIGVWAGSAELDLRSRPASRRTPEPVPTPPHPPVRPSRAMPPSPEVDTTVVASRACVEAAALRSHPIVQVDLADPAVPTAPPAANPAGGDDHRRRWLGDAEDYQRWEAEAADRWRPHASSPSTPFRDLVLPESSLGDVSTATTTDTVARAVEWIGPGATR